MLRKTGIICVQAILDMQILFFYIFKEIGKNLGSFLSKTYVWRLSWRLRLLKTIIIEKFKLINFFLKFYNA